MSDKESDSEGEQTLIRQVPNDDKTHIRNVPSEPTDGQSNDLAGQSAQKGVKKDIEADETIIRKQDKTAVNPSVSSGDKPPSDAATILRQPESSKQSSPPSKAAATILRSPGETDKAGATILAEGRTILNPGVLDDATTIPGGDDDSTIINSMGDDDSTIIGGAGAGKMDTTYIAGVADSSKSRGNTEAGRLLKNRFVLEERIGSGGMGDVYKALDLRQQEAKERNPYIAIKILNETFARHKDAFISLQREATRTRGIPHPNIMGVYDFDREGDTVFMSMELLDGKPLDDYLKEHPEGVSVEDAWNIIDGICQGLSRAHGAGIVHSDFKPGNIYYTTEKIAKVFDFGIARAVPTSDGEALESEGDATVFDAGSLGALTPTYASLEMLTGKTPTKSDDVYAVALVAYELFTGKHPYNRTPANKALDQGLVPEPVSFLKRRQWKALKKALELSGEDRTQTVDEFYEIMFSKDPPYFTYAAVTMVLVASVGYGVYQQFRVPEVLPDGFVELVQAFTTSESDIRNRLLNPDFKSETFRGAFSNALNRMILTNNQAHEPQWAEYLEEDWQGNWDTLPVQLINMSKIAIVDGYLDAIEKIKNDVVEQYSQNEEEIVKEAIRQLEEASLYLVEVKKGFSFRQAEGVSEVDDELLRQMAELSERMNEETLTLSTRLGIKRASLDEIILKAENELAAREAAALKAEFQRHEDDAKDRFRAAYVEGQNGFEKILLSCKGQLSEESQTELGVIIEEMRTNHPSQFQIDKPGYVAALAGCIGDRIALSDPKMARKVRALVMTYLPGEGAISSIEIFDKDPCAKRKLVGQGNRNRNWCWDELAIGGASGPQLVVIPSKFGENSLDKFAISRMEIKVSEYNLYCKNAGCAQADGEPSNPVTNISFEQANQYTSWLSSKSLGVYRLPTTSEWLYAAISTAGTIDKVELDTNINCTVDSRGVRLGDRLVNTQSGKPNDWGLYNFVGNAREWATQKSEEGDELFALGGAHTDARSACRIDLAITHSGESDRVTGFRVVRLIEDAKKPS